MDRPVGREGPDPGKDTGRGHVACLTGTVKAPSRLLDAPATGLVRPKPNRQQSLRAIGLPTTMPKKPPTALIRVPESLSPTPLNVVLVIW
jgi:hypothetical protein